MSYYQSNYNKNRRPSFKQVLQSLVNYPLYLIQKIREEKDLRKKILRVIIFVAATFLLLGSLTFAAVSLSLPDPNKLNARIIPQSTKIYARDGTTLLYEVHGEAKRTLLNFDEMPENVKQATIAIEDKNFYRNPVIIRLSSCLTFSDSRFSRYSAQYTFSFFCMKTESMHTHTLHTVHGLCV